MSKYCIKCGNLLDDNASFCENCGAQMQSAPERPYQQQNLQEYQQYVQPNLQQPEEFAGSGDVPPQTPPQSPLTQQYGFVPDNT